VVHSSEQVTAHAEEIECEALDGEKPLCVSGGLEPAHLALALPGRLVGEFRPIVRVLVRPVNHRRHHDAERRRVATQLVRDQATRSQPWLFNGIVKLTKISVIDPQDIVVGLLRGPTCWVSESACCLNLTVPSILP